VSTETAQRILVAACDLIAEDGIDAVRIARVAQRAGASTALVHHYFSTREELLEQALIHSFEQAGEERFGDEAPPPASSATETLALAIRESLPYPGAQRREWVLWVELWLRAVRDEELGAVAARMYKRYRSWMSGLIQTGVDSGEFGAGTDVDRATDVAIALLDGTGVRALFGDPAMSVEEARLIVARALAPELGIEPEALSD
jgi:AcrR family transcriptional regulator